MRWRPSPPAAGRVESRVGAMEKAISLGCTEGDLAPRPRATSSRPCPTRSASVPSEKLGQAGSNSGWRLSAADADGDWRRPVPMVSGGGDYGWGLAARTLWRRRQRMEIGGGRFRWRVAAATTDGEWRRWLRMASDDKNATRNWRGNSSGN
ncbi:hypothetical protein SEVIR_7G022204v4 [Setaria viridis]